MWTSPPYLSFLLSQSVDIFWKDDDIDNTEVDDSDDSYKMVIIMMMMMMKTLGKMHGQGSLQGRQMGHRPHGSRSQIW